MVPSRETLLHFFERIRRAFPALHRLRRRDDGALVLDEEGPESQASRRLLRVDGHALKLGYYSPPSIEAVDQFATLVLEQAPHHLSLSDLDFEHLEVAIGFDLEFRGNHDELVAEALFSDHPLLNALAADGQHVIDCQPFFGIALSADCELQAFVEIKGRTSAFEVRSGEYEPTPLSVYATVRRYWTPGRVEDLAAAHRGLLRQAEQLASARVVPHVVQPLAEAIASRR